MQRRREGFDGAFGTWNVGMGKALCVLAWTTLGL